MRAALAFLLAHNVCARASLLCFVAACALVCLLCAHTNARLQAPPYSRSTGQGRQAWSRRLSGVCLEGGGEEGE